MNEELKHHEKAPLLRVCGILGGGGGGGEVGGKMWEDAECCFFSRWTMALSLSNVTSDITCHLI